MTPHFCLPARQAGLHHMIPAGTSRPRRGRCGAGEEKTCISPGRPLSPRRSPRQRAGRCLRSAPHQLRGPPRGSPGSAPHHALAGDGGVTRPGEGRAAAGPSPPLPERGGGGRRERRQAPSCRRRRPGDSSPPPPLPPAPARPAAPAAGAAAGPAPPHARLPAHLGARTRSGPPRRPPPASYSGGGRAGRGGAGPAAEVTARPPIAGAAAPARLPSRPAPPRPT